MKRESRLPSKRKNVLQEVAAESSRREKAGESGDHPGGTSCGQGGGVSYPGGKTQEGGGTVLRRRGVCPERKEGDLLGYSPHGKEDLGGGRVEVAREEKRKKGTLEKFSSLLSGRGGSAPNQKKKIAPNYEEKGERGGVSDRFLIQQPEGEKGSGTTTKRKGKGEKLEDLELPSGEGGEGNRLRHRESTGVSRSSFPLRKETRNKEKGRLTSK